MSRDQDACIPLEISLKFYSLNVQQDNPAVISLWPSGNKIISDKNADLTMQVSLNKTP